MADPQVRVQQPSPHLCHEETSTVTNPDLGVTCTAVLTKMVLCSTTSFTSYTTTKEYNSVQPKNPYGLTPTSLFLLSTPVSLCLPQTGTGIRTLDDVHAPRKDASLALSYKEALKATGRVTHSFFPAGPSRLVSVPHN